MSSSAHAHAHLQRSHESENGSVCGTAEPSGKERPQDCASGRLLWRTTGADVLHIVMLDCVQDWLSLSTLFERSSGPSNIKLNWSGLTFRTRCYANSNSFLLQSCGPGRSGPVGHTVPGGAVYTV